MHAEFLAWSAHALFLWGLRPVSGSKFFVHQKRELNAAADLLANRAVREGGWAQIVWNGELASGDVLVVCTDGASKGNPGPSGSAAVVFLHRQNTLLEIASSGYRCDRSTSVVAEFEAACIGIHLLCAWFLSAGVAVPRDRGG
jgi:ribonuclease HI